MSSQQWMREDFRLDVECGLCGFAGAVDGWEDREVSKWGWDCPSCDFPHSHYIDERGAVSAAGSFWLFAAAVTGIAFWVWQPVLFWVVVALALYTGICLALLAVVHGGRINETTKPEEGDQ